MELIGPEQYAESIKNKTVEELHSIKNKLLQEIKDLERLSRHPEDSVWGFDQIDTMLSVYKEYLLKRKVSLKLKNIFKN